MTACLGLATCNWRLCSFTDGSSNLHLSWILLYSLMRHNWHEVPCSTWRCTLSFLSTPDYLWRACTHNGLCSSITELKHVKAVKKPWRCSSKFQALGQMLLTNQCNDKLVASRVDFNSCGMLVGTCLSYVLLTLYKFYCLCYIWKWK